MTINYSLDEKDFLAYQLYVASHSPSIKRKRQKSNLLFSLAYCFVGVFFIFQNNSLLAICFFMVGIVSFFVHPILDRRRYFKHYQATIKESYQGRLGRNLSLGFNNDYIIATDNGSESKVTTTEIVEIIEISSSFFLNLKSGQAFIIPKDKIENIELLTIKLKNLASHLNIKYDLDAKWKWR